MLDLERDDFFQQFNNVTNAFAKKKLWKQIQELRPTGAQETSTPASPTPPQTGGGGPPPQKWKPTIPDKKTEETLTPLQQFYQTKAKMPWEKKKEDESQSGSSLVQDRLAKYKEFSQQTPWERDANDDAGEELQSGSSLVQERLAKYKQFSQNNPASLMNTEGGPPFPTGNTPFPGGGPPGFAPPGFGERPPGMSTGTVKTGDSYMTVGVIRNYLKDRNYGFILENESMKDVYFHTSNFLPTVDRDSVEDGDLMQFRCVKSNQGWEAHDIEPIQPPAPKPRVAGFITALPDPERIGSKKGNIFDHEGYHLYFLLKDCQQQLVVGDYVSFEVMSTVEKPRALKIKKIVWSRGFVEELSFQGGLILEDHGLKVSFHDGEISAGEELQQGDYVKFKVKKVFQQNFASDITKNVEARHRPKPPGYVGTSRGIVSDYYKDKDYGFIKDLTNGNTIFVHSDQLVCEPKVLFPDDFVQFDVSAVPKGFKAHNCVKMQLPKPRGKITLWNRERRFGHVRDRQGVDLYFESEGCKNRPKSPEQGDIVEFDLEGGSKGPTAVNMLWVEPDWEMDQDLPRSEGEVKELNHDHGFIYQDDGGPDAYFLPMDTDEREPIFPGARVQYAVLPTGKGPKAFNIRVITQKKKKKNKIRLKGGVSHGKLKCYYPKKKIGYLKDQKGADLFYRVSQWKGGGSPLARDGQPVKYVIVVDDRGPRATNIHIHDGSNFLGNFPDDNEHPNDMVDEDDRLGLDQYGSDEDRHAPGNQRKTFTELV